MPILPSRGSRKPPPYCGWSKDEEGPICIGPLYLFLLLALGVSLVAMLPSILGMLLGVC
jgi:hypothetical protein